MKLHTLENQLKDIKISYELHAVDISIFLLSKSLFNISYTSVEKRFSNNPTYLKVMMYIHVNPTFSACLPELCTNY